MGSPCSHCRLGAPRRQDRHCRASAEGRRKEGSSACGELLDFVVSCPRFLFVCIALSPKRNLTFSRGLTDLLQCGLLKKLPSRKTSGGYATKLFLDGNEDKACRVLKRHVKPDHVKHRKKEFVSRKKGNGLWGGTQTLDSLWQHLDRFVGSRLKTRTTDGNINPRLMDKAFAWCFRYNLSSQEKDNFMATLGLALQRCVTKRVT